MHCFKFDVYVVIHSLLYYMEFGRVLDTPYNNIFYCIFYYQTYFVVPYGGWQSRV